MYNGVDCESDRDVPAAGRDNRTGRDTPAQDAMMPLSVVPAKGWSSVRHGMRLTDSALYTIYMHQISTESSLGILTRLCAIRGTWHVCGVCACPNSSVPDSAWAAISVSGTGNLPSCIRPFATFVPRSHCTLHLATSVAAPCASCVSKLPGRSQSNRAYKLGCRWPTPSCLVSRKPPFSHRPINPVKLLHPGPP